jgi:hypothetical protein
VRKPNYFHENSLGDKDMGGKEKRAGGREED